MFATTQKTDAAALRSLSQTEIEAVAGGMFATYEPIGDRSVVGCGTMVLLDRLLKIFRGGR